MTYKRRKIVTMYELLRTMTAQEIRLICDWCQFVIDRARASEKAKAGRK